MQNMLRMCGGLQTATLSVAVPLAVSVVRGQENLHVSKSAEAQLYYSDREQRGTHTA